jgi:hypothetical protein
MFTSPTSQADEKELKYLNALSVIKMSSHCIFIFHISLNLNLIHHMFKLMSFLYFCIYTLHKKLLLLLSLLVLVLLLNITNLLGVPYDLLIFLSKQLYFSFIFIIIFLARSSKDTPYFLSQLDKSCGT